MSMQNKAAALNALHTAINAIVPELQAYIASNTIKFKDGGEMYKKNAEAVKGILEKHLPKQAYAYLRSYGDNCFCLDTKTHFQSGQFSVTYVDVWVKLEDFEPMRTNFKAEDFTTAQQEWEALHEQIRTLQAKQSQVKREYHL